MKDDVVQKNIVIKSGIWYTISNFAFRAVAFITTPIFARILTKSEYGEFNNIASWISILSVFTSCDLYTSIIRAKLDYKEDLESYSLSVLTLGSIITICLYVLTICFSGILSNLMGINAQYFHVIFIYLFFVQGFNVYITLERAYYKYKSFSLLTGVGIVCSCLLSIILVCKLKNKLDARIYGQYIPYIIIGLVLYIFVIRRGKRINFKYYKYSLLISLPLVPHLLSMTLLSSSDRIMINQLVGPEFTAIYSVAYIITNIIVVLIDSMNKAWAPWFLDMMKLGEYDAINKTVPSYYIIFLLLIIGVLLFAPEVLFVLGGENYISGIYVLPPLIIGCVFQFVYTMYVQIEFYEKKMKMVATATFIAAIINVLLNYILLPLFGFVAAGYTTLIGYILLFLLHFKTVCKLGYKNIFNTKMIAGGLLLSLICIPLFLFVYKINVIRYLLILIYLFFLCYLLLKHKKEILKFIINKKV